MGWQGSPISSARKSTLPQDWISVWKLCFHLPPGLRFSVYGFFCFCFWPLSFALWSLQISGCRHYWKPAEAFHAFSVVLLWGLQIHWKSDSALALSECGTLRSTESRSTASVEAPFHFHPACNCKKRDEKPCAACTCSFVFLIVAFPSHDQYTRVLLGSCWCSLKLKVVKLCKVERH